MVKCLYVSTVTQTPQNCDISAMFTVTGRSRSDASQSVSEGTDRDFTDVTLVSEDTY